MVDVENENKVGTITTHVGKDSGGMKLVKVKSSGGLPIMENTKQGYKVADTGDGVNLASRMKHQRGNVQKGSIQTLKAQMEIGVVVNEENKNKDS